MQKLVTPEFRVSFPAVFQPKAFEGQEPKYSVVMLFNKKTDITKMKEMAKKTIEEKWPNTAERPKNLKNPFRDGDIERPDVDGYAGHIFITCSSKMKPGIVDANLQPILSEDDFYAGCYARATVTCFAYDKAGNRGVSFGLQNLQFLRAGETFSGRAKAEDDFEAITTTTDDIF